jgi:RNA polymerase sigma-70 factor (ECF subfamily)
MSAEVTVEQVVGAAKLARPDLGVDETAFAVFLSGRPLGGSALQHAGDLALVFACSKGDARALSVLDAEYLSRMADILPSRYRDDAAEVAQVLRVRLLVPDDEGYAKIAGFTGKGGLAGWLRVAGVRAALNIKRSTKRETPLDENDALLERAGGDVELDHLKQRYRKEFKEAFAAALAALEPRSRNLLRQHYLDGVPMESIGQLYGVHRLTIVRWMEKARLGLAEETRRELTARLKVDKRELESILRLIESRVEVTLSDVLR